ncbi:uncharacterized protein LOC128196677 [Vigna angularis]|uniref:uncharacterized protein LOC128196677 n=1 Tax=Phaseolus angularis TaxID=3914 RepID=UPI0022B5D16A|nr:uncharacterized protein LOC128196677 [Vigna angularis]
MVEAARSRQRGRGGEDCAEAIFITFVSLAQHHYAIGLRILYQLVFEINQSNGDVLHSPSQVGGNSHLQDEHEQDEIQDSLLEVEQERPPIHKGAWLVDIIGKTQVQHINACIMLLISAEVL